VVASPYHSNNNDSTRQDGLHPPLIGWLWIESHIGDGHSPMGTPHWEPYTPKMGCAGPCSVGVGPGRFGQTDQASTLIGHPGCLPLGAIVVVPPVHTCTYHSGEMVILKCHSHSNRALTNGSGRDGPQESQCYQKVIWPPNRPYLEVSEAI
jgi:hypothetical protein